MQVYQRETQEILKRFREGRISFRECIAALDAALAGLSPQPTEEELKSIKALLAAKIETVMHEMHVMERWEPETELQFASVPN